MKIGDVIEKPTTAAKPSENIELKEDLTLAKATATKMDAKKVAQHADAVQAKLQDILKDQGLTEKRAQEIAIGIRDNGVAAFAGA